MNAPRLLVAVCCAIAIIVVAPARAGLTEPERLVVARLNAGENAEFDISLGQEKPKLSGKFLEQLLTGKIGGCTPKNNVIYILNAATDDKVHLTNQTIPYSIYFTNCSFNNYFSLTDSTIAGGVEIMECSFELSAEFDRVHFGNSLSLNHTVFKTGLLLRNAQVAEYFEATGTEFRWGYFQGMHVAGDAIFDNAVASQADFSSAEAHNFKAPDATFRDGVTFDGLKLKGDLLLSGAKFEGPIFCRRAEIGGRFLAGDKTEFKNKTDGSVFTKTKVGGDVFLSGSTFAGRAIFDEIEVHGDLNTNGTEFQYDSKDQKPAANFYRAQIDGAVRLDPPFSQGEISFKYATLGDLSVSVRENNHAGLPALNLFGARITRTLTLDRIRISKLLAGELHVEGPATLNGVNFNGIVNFDYTRFGILHVHGVSWPTNPEFLRIEGMNFRSLEAGNDRDPNDLILSLAGRAKYSALVYSDLVTYFTKQGSLAMADKAFVKGKHRERQQLSRWQPAWMNSMALNLLVGYGRHPRQAIIACIAVVALGCFLFRRDRMERQKKPEEGEPKRFYYAFWYSLGLFLPVVNLQTTELWKPKAECNFLRHYMRVHILLGWIFIPIVVAAITGLIK